MKLKSLLVAACCAATTTIVAPQVLAAETTSPTTTATESTTMTTPASTTPATTTTPAPGDEEDLATGSSGVDALVKWNKEMAPVGRSLAAVIDLATLVISVLGLLGALAKLPGINEMVKKALRDAGLKR